MAFDENASTIARDDAMITLVPPPLTLTHRDTDQPITRCAVTLGPATSVDTVLGGPVAASPGRLTHALVRDRSDLASDGRPYKIIITDRRARKIRDTCFVPAETAGL